VATGSGRSGSAAQRSLPAVFGGLNNVSTTEVWEMLGWVGLFGGVFVAVALGL